MAMPSFLSSGAQRLPTIPNAVSGDEQFICVVCRVMESISHMDMGNKNLVSWEICLLEFEFSKKGTVAFLGRKTYSDENMVGWPSWLKAAVC